MSDAFRSFHRARRRASLRVRVPLGMLVGAVRVDLSLPPIVAG